MLEDAATHIYEAILHGRTDIVKMLIAEVRTGLKSQYPNKVMLDVEFDTFLNSKHNDATTFLHQAVLSRQRDVMRALLQDGADPSVICKVWDTDDENESGDGENALQASVKLNNMSDEDNGKNCFTRVFGEILFQATASSRYVI